MAENSDHAPGIKQHQKLARTGEPYAQGETFGVGSVPGTERIKGEPPNATMLSDKERSVGHPVHMGREHMPASRNPDHGPHHHRKSAFE
jgi:hypothetical protein